MHRVEGLLVERDGERLLGPVDIEFEPGGMTLMVGPSGAGKTSILMSLCGVGRKVGLRVEGRIFARDGSVSSLDSADRPASSLVFQDDALYDDLTVRQNLRLVATRAPTEADLGVLARLLDGIDQDALPSQLSGGQRQRVAIARSLYAGANLVLMDEPNSGLDMRRTAALAGILKTVCDAGHHVVITTHYPEPFLDRATQVLYLDGQGGMVALPPQIEDIRAAFGVVEEEAQKAGSHSRTAIPTVPAPTAVRWRWLMKFFGREVWSLMLAPSNLLYATVACALLAFTTAYVTVTRYPFSEAVLDMTLERLVAELGDASYRFTVPLIVSILIAARSGALATTDLSMKQLSGSMLALEQLRVPIVAYRGLSLVTALAFMMPVLYVTALVVALYMIVMAVGVATDVPFTVIRAFVVSDFLTGDGPPASWGWVLAKTMLSGLAVALISFVIGRRAVASGRDITAAASLSVLTAVLAVIALHSALTLWELYV